MKSLIFTLLLLPQIGWTKVSNFGEMIHENARAQSQLHNQLNQTQGWGQEAVKVSPQHVVLETTVSDYNPKTKKSLLTYKKEKIDNSPSYKKQMHRVADEMEVSGKDQL